MGGDVLLRRSTDSVNVPAREVIPSPTPPTAYSISEMPRPRLNLIRSRWSSGKSLLEQLVQIFSRGRCQRERLTIRRAGHRKPEFRCIEIDRKSADLPTQTIRETRGVREKIQRPVIKCGDFMMRYAVFRLTKIAREQGEAAARLRLRSWVASVPMKSRSPATRGAALSSTRESRRRSASCPGRGRFVESHPSRRRIGHLTSMRGPSRNASRQGDSIASRLV